MDPCVTVVITTLNQAAYTEAALRSVVNQTYRAIEVVVVDDGSTDKTPAVIRAFAHDVRSIRYIRQANAGVAAARNTGVRHATGAFVAFLEGDDLWEPEKLAVQVAAATRFPDSGLTVTDGIKFSADGVLDSTLFGHLPAQFNRVGVDVSRGAVYKHLLRGNFISTVSQVMVPTSVLRAIGPSDPHLPLASDYDLYLRIAARYDALFVARPLVRWRSHRARASGPEDVRDLRWNHDNIRILRKHLREAPVHGREPVRLSLERRIRAAAQTAYYFGRQTDRRQATRYLLGLLLANPGHLAVAAFLAGLWCPQPIASLLGGAFRPQIAPQAAAPQVPAKTRISGS